MSNCINFRVIALELRAELTKCQRLNSELLEVARAAELFAKGEALPTRQQLLESAQKAIAKARGEQ